MEQEIRNFLVEYLHLDNVRVINELTELGSIIDLKPKSILFQKNIKPENLVFLLDGIIRGYSINSDGEEATICFEYRVGSPVVPSLPLDNVAIISMETITQSKVIQFPIKYVVELIKSDIVISQMYNNLLTQSMRRNYTLMKVISEKTSDQRYQWFLSEYAGIANKISDKYVAQFLNMSTVHLSRVKKALGMSKKYNRS